MDAHFVHRPIELCILGIAQLDALRVGLDLGSASDVLQDIASMLGALAWPAVVVVVVLIFRKEFPKLVQALSGRISGLSAVGVSFEFAAAEPDPETLHLLEEVREPSTTGPPPPSGTKSLLELANSSPRRADYLVIDLRDGHAWLTSRLYLFSVVLSPVLGLRCLVFVGTRGLVPRSFLGLSSPETVARALETRYTWLRNAMVRAQLQTLIVGEPLNHSVSWLPYGDAALALKRLVPNVDKWDVTCGEALDEIVRALVNPLDLFQRGQVEIFVNRFLQSPDLRRPQKATPPDKDWVNLGAVDEHAEWIKDERHLLDVIGDALRRDEVADNSTNEDDVIEKAVLRRRGSSFVAVTDSEGRLDRLIDRAAMLERLAAGKRK